MKNELEKLSIEHGDRLKIIPIECLYELKEIIENFKGQGWLNDFQKWVINDLYQFESSDGDFKANSIIIVAVPHPFCAKVDFRKEGNKRTFFSLVRSDFVKTEMYLKKYMGEKGYSIRLAKNLPLKRLGTHSGLAKYGRNNITYIDGLGSNFSYIAYFSDLVCEEYSWSEMKNAEACNKCNLCMESCPTGAIGRDIFLIDSPKCLSFMNEVPGEFPAWLPIEAHHALYDCLVCQRVCPMNYEQVDNIIECISFTEEETDMLLNGKPLDTFSDEFKTKAYTLGINEWYGAIPRNLKTLFEK